VKQGQLVEGMEVDLLNDIEAAVTGQPNAE
jgi:hypothetical protein